MNTNTTLEDLASIIGFTATATLSIWLTGNNPHGHRLYVPQNPPPEHHLVKLLGLSAARRLGEAWGNQHIHVPSMQSFERTKRFRYIARQIELGETYGNIAAHIGMTKRRVEQIAQELRGMGILEENSPGKTPRKNSQEKHPSKTPPENAQLEPPLETSEEFALQNYWMRGLVDSSVDAESEVGDVD